MEQKINLENFLEKTTRKCKKLKYEGQAYTVHRSNNKKIVWRCVNRNCTGRIHTTSDYFLIKQRLHIHEPIHDQLDAEAMMEAIKVKALDTKEPPREIIIDKIKKEPETFIQGKINLQYARDCITRIRKTNNFTYEKNSDIPIEVQKLSSGEQFYLHDNGISNPNRIIIFGTDTGLQFLSLSKVWFVDSTFKVVPEPFQQLFIIQAIVKNKKLSLLYALMSKKDEDSYEHILNILDKKINPMVEWIILDYELSLFNSLNKIYPKIKLRGCWFHLNQIFQRKLSRIGFKDIFKKNNDFRLHCRLILSLAAIPTYKIRDELENLYHYILNYPRKIEQSLIMFHWFKLNFITDIKLLNHEPIFWSVYDRILNNVPRTTNSLEAYNRHLNSIAETNHPSIYSIASELQKEMELCTIYLLQLNNVEEIINNPDNKELNIIKEYGKMIGINYLRRIVSNFNFALDI